MANKLKAALAKSVTAPPIKEPAEAVRPAEAPIGQAEPATLKRQRSTTDKPERPDRAGRVLIGGHFEGELARRWNILAAELGVTKQELLRQAILATLEKHNAR